MGLDYLQDPQFWIVQALMGVLFMFSRFPVELAEWLVGRSVHRAERQLKAHADAVDDEALRVRIEELVTDYVEAPRLLRLYYALAIVREERRLTSPGDGEPPSPESGPGGGALPLPSSNTMSPQQPSENGDLGDPTTAVSSVPGPSRRQRIDALVNAVCARLAALSGRIVGGEYGSDYEAEMAQDLAGTRKRLIRVFYALSNVIGAFRLRLILRTFPFLRGILVPVDGGWRLSLLAVIDYVVASDLVCAGITVAVDVVTLLYIRGWLGLTFASWVALPVALISAYGQSRIRRAWRAARETEEQG
ncbi:hypothetical protein [Streptomyces sviceus]|uniref:hypothetical protein n=1 Tax=Streptomyces sviceus TaxID=285530 RepID=UPI0036E8271E